MNDDIQITINMYANQLYMDRVFDNLSRFPLQICALDACLLESVPWLSG